MRTKAWKGIAMLAMSIGIHGAAHADLVTNGSFETTTNGTGHMGYNTDVTGWATTGYNFVFASGVADTTGAVGRGGKIYLWGPNDGSANGLTASSPDGGNFIAADGAYQTEAITQTITGLTVGQTYRVGFDWGAAQQKNYDGATTEKWKVSLGSNTQTTSVLSIPTHGFSGWQSQTFDYVATSSSEVLSFLASGTPNGVPPFALLDGVTMNQVQGSNVPEPNSIVLLFAVTIGGSVLLHRRSRAVKTAKSAA